MKQVAEEFIQGRDVVPGDVLRWCSNTLLVLSKDQHALSNEAFCLLDDECVSVTFWNDEWLKRLG